MSTLSKKANSQVSMGNLQSNPFAQVANGQNSQQPQVTLQSAGFIVPHKTALPQQANPFDNFQPQQQSTHWPFSSYLLSQQTGFHLQPLQTSGFLQSSQQPFLQPRPRLTRNSPFLQSMLVPQSTGMTLFGASQENYTPNVQSPQDADPASLSWVSASMPLPAPMAASSNNSPAHPSSSPFTAYEAPFSSLLSQRTGFQLQPPQTSGLLQSSQQPFLQPRPWLT